MLFLQITHEYQLLLFVWFFTLCFSVYFIYLCVMVTSKFKKIKKLLISNLFWLNFKIKIKTEFSIKRISKQLTEKNRDYFLFNIYCGPQKIIKCNKSLQYESIRRFYQTNSASSRKYIPNFKTKVATNILSIFANYAFCSA